MSHSGPILIVDDEASIRKSLEGVLSDEGYSCALASDGADALARLNRFIRRWCFSTSGCRGWTGSRRFGA